MRDANLVASCFESSTDLILKAGNR